MEIIDIHTHIYPEKIAAKAVKAIGDFYTIPMYSDGIAKTLIENGSKIGVKNYVVHSAATVPEQVSHINQFLLKTVKDYKEFIPFGTLHASLSEEEIENEIDFMLNNGFKGIKIHPDFQKFNIDDPKAIRIYEILDGKLPILFHVGDQTHDFSAPERLIKIAKKFKKQKLICAHFGGYSKWDKIDDFYEVAKNGNVFFDTSSSISMLDKEFVVKKINKFGADKFMWGTDFPMWSHEGELNYFLSLNLSTDDKEKILHINAENFLGLK